VIHPSQEAIEERIVRVALEAMREKYGRPPSAKPVLRVVPKAETVATSMRRAIAPADPDRAVEAERRNSDVQEEFEVRRLIEALRDKWGRPPAVKPVLAIVPKEA
jgi:hypothetical protein